MTSTGFESAKSLDDWCRQRNIPTHEGRVRFMEFVVLACISADNKLSSSLVFKGGNALRFVYQSPRSTIDLDFTVVPNTLSDDTDEIRQTLDDALKWAMNRYNVKAKCQSVKRNPPGPNHTHPTYGIKIGYRYRLDRYFADFETSERNVSTVIPIEISINDLVCEN